MTPEHFLKHPKRDRIISQIVRDTGLPTFKLEKGIRDGTLLPPSRIDGVWDYNPMYWKSAVHLHYRCKDHKHVRVHNTVAAYLIDIEVHTHLSHSRVRALYHSQTLPIHKEPYTGRFLYHPAHWRSYKNGATRPTRTLAGIYYEKLKGDLPLYKQIFNESMSRKRYYLIRLWAYERLQQLYPNTYSMSDVRDLWHDMLTDPNVGSYRLSAMSRIFRRLDEKPSSRINDSWYVAVWRNQLVQYTKYQYRKKCRAEKVQFAATRQLPYSRQKSQQIIAVSYDAIRKAIKKAGGSDLLKYLKNVGRNQRSIGRAVQSLRVLLPSMRPSLTKCWISAYLGKLQILE